MPETRLQTARRHRDRGLVPAAPLRIGTLAAVGALFVAAACEDVVVQPADVKTIVVSPPQAVTAVGSAVQLSAEAYDNDDQPLSGYSISWRVDDEDIATVDGDGRVTGISRGTTTVRASVGSTEGAASLSVREAPSIDLDRSSVGFEANAGGGSPSGVEVAVRNGGEGSLSGLQTSTSYEGSSGWLTASLAGTSAPTSLTLRASPGSLQPGTYQATVRVSASVASNSPVSIQVSFEVRKPPVPGRPSGLAATYDDGEIRLEWSDPSGSETGFRIERRVEGGSFQEVGSVGEDVTRYDDDDIQVDRRYTYRVKACNEIGCSDPSAEASAVTPPTAPTNLRLIYAKEDRVKIVWTDASSHESVFRIERARLGQSYTVIGEVDRDVKEYEDRSVNEDTRYWYRVRACNDSGCSDPSNVVSGRTDD